MKIQLSLLLVHAFAGTMASSAVVPEDHKTETSFDPKHGPDEHGFVRGTTRNLATCGGGSRGDGTCPNGLCCSEWGWCGTSSAHCSGSNPAPGPGPSPSGGTCGGGSRGDGVCSDGTCCSEWGWCGSSSAHCSGSNPAPGPGPAPGPAPSPGGGTCGGGSRGDGVCSDGTCCSEWGWCGTTSEHCSGSNPAPGPAPGPAPSPGGGTSLYSGSGSGTYYYDVTGRTCNGAPQYAENNGYPACTSYDPSFWKTVQQYGTNNMVAIDRTLLSTPEGRARYCGKQIKVYRNGAEVSGGPFFVFDGCQACEGGTRIDFSVSALDSISGGTACFDGVVSGISWDVIDNQIETFVP